MSLSIYLDINRGSDAGDLHIARDMLLDYSWRLDNSQGISTGTTLFTLTYSPTKLRQLNSLLGHVHNVDTRHI